MKEIKLACNLLEYHIERIAEIKAMVVKTIGEDPEEVDSFISNELERYYEKYEEMTPDDIYKYALLREVENLETGV